MNNVILFYHIPCPYFLIQMCLAEMSLETDNDNMLFAGVEQLNMGGPSAVSNDDQRVKVAHFNVIAGKKSMDQSDFHSGVSIVGRYGN